MHLVRRIHRSIVSRLRRRVRELQLAAFSFRLGLRRWRSLKAPTAPGVTVIVASWNTERYLRVLIEAVHRFSPPSVRILAVDNASTDKTLEMLGVEHPEVQLVALRRNVGHGLALDAGIQAARTDVVVVLDVDAFPIARDWLDAVLIPLTSGCSLAGADFGGYIHPCFMAIERRHFLEQRYTFDASYSRRIRIRRRGWPRNWDAGQLISELDKGTHHPIPVTSTRGPAVLGTVFGGVVYHHFYSTRHIASWRVPEAESEQAWVEATDRYLPRDEP